MTASTDWVDQFIGKRVRLQREILGISATGLAGKLGVTTEELREYERGAIRMCPEQLVKITEVFQMSIVCFFEGLARKGDARARADTA
jgi:transcriptional regulator with XRE-family HTH domain